MAEPCAAGRGKRSLCAAVLLLLLAVAAALYLPHAGIPYYADDYLFRPVDPWAGLFGYFGPLVVPNNFRPLQMSWIAVNLLLFGESTFALQAGQVIAHVLLAGVVYWFLRHRGLGLTASLLAAVWLAAAQIAVPAILGNDTGSQVGATLFGFAGFVLAWQYAAAQLASSPINRPQRWMAVGSILALAIALLWKETALSFAGILTFVLLYFVAMARRSSPPAPVGRLLLLAAGVVALTAAYFGYRETVVSLRVAYGRSSPYAFHVGGNVPIIIALLPAGALLPVSSAEIAAAIQGRVVPQLVGAGLLFTLWIGVLAAGITLARAWRAAFGWLFLAACATVPMCLLIHPSELYSYNVLPFVAIVVGIGLGGLLDRRRALWLRAAGALVFAAVLVSNAIAVQQKAACMGHNGAATAAMLPQVVEVARKLPPGGRLLLYEQDQPDFHRYSVFYTTDFHGLNAAEPWIQRWAGRPDIAVRIRDALLRGRRDLETTRLLAWADTVLIRDDATWPPTVRVKPNP
ncbi:MAG: hypothetical protein AB1716_03435 [Planctomycetota bacterium]